MLCFPVPSVDLSVTTFDLSDDLKVGRSTSFKLTAHVRLFQMELPASDWAHFDYKLYVSKDKKLDADLDYEIPYRFVRHVLISYWSAMIVDWIIVIPFLDNIVLDNVTKLQQLLSKGCGSVFMFSSFYTTS